MSSLDGQEKDKQLSLNITCILKNHSVSGYTQVVVPRQVGYVGKLNYKIQTGYIIKTHKHKFVENLSS